MSAGGTTSNIQIGPGRLYVAPVGTAFPISASAAIPSAFWSLGYTEDGSTITLDITRAPVIVAEELDPVDYVNAARIIKLIVNLAEVTKKRLAMSLAMGVGYLDDAAYLDFPDATTPAIGICAIWDSAEDPTDLTLDNRRWCFSKMLPSGPIAITRKKSPAKASLPIELDAVKVTGLPLVRVFPNSHGLV